VAGSTWNCLHAGPSGSSHSVSGQLATANTVRRGPGQNDPKQTFSELSLVDYTGRALRRGKRGRIDDALRPILERLESRGAPTWLDDIAHLRRRYYREIGSVLSVREYRDLLRQRKLNGVVG